MRRFIGGVGLLLFSFLTLNGNAAAEVVYHNPSPDATKMYPSQSEYGDEIWLDGTARIVTDFFFDYFGDFVPQGDEEARIRFYANDGPAYSADIRSPIPGTLLYDSGYFPVSTGYVEHAISNLSVKVPDVFTWTVHFRGFSGLGNDRAGLMIAETPKIGQSFRDFWLFLRGRSWELFSFPNFNPIANFGATVIAFEEAKLSIRPEGNKVRIEWPPEYVLQVSESVSGPYRDLLGAVSPFLVPVQTAPSLFWKLRALTAADIPQLTMQREGDELILEWNIPAFLQSANRVQGPYSDVLGATSPYRVKISEAAQLFWRLRVPDGLLETAPTPLVFDVQIRFVDGQIVLQWDAPGILQRASQVNGPYEDVLNASSPYAFVPDGSQSFWRVRPPGSGEVELRLDLTRSGEQLVLQWSGNAVLQTSINASGPYQDVPDASSPYTAPLESPNRFWRLRTPGITTQSMAPPSLTSSRSGNLLTLTWAGAGILQGATELTGQYIDLPEAISPYQYDLSSGALRYFRVRPVTMAAEH